MQNLNFSLKDLIENWVSKTIPKKTYFQCLETAWKEICSQEGSCVAEIIFEKQELIIEVENHLVMCNLQFEALELLNKINQILARMEQKEKVCKLRFRLKRLNS